MPAGRLDGRRASAASEAISPAILRQAKLKIAERVRDKNDPIRLGIISKAEV